MVPKRLHVEGAAGRGPFAAFPARTAVQGMRPASAPVGLADAADPAKLEA